MGKIHAIYNLFNTFTSYSDSIGLSIVFFSLISNYSKLISNYKRWILFFYLIFFLSTLVTALLNVFSETNNWMYNLLPILLTIPLFFFFNQLHDSRFLKIFNTSYFLIYLAGAIIFWQNIFQLYLNPFFYLLFSFYILFNSVGYLNEEMTTMRSQNLFQKTEFWFIACLFFYATICVIVWSLFSYLEHNSSAQKKFLHPGHLWMYGHNTTLFIQSFVFSIAIFKTAVRK